MQQEDLTITSIGREL